MCDVWKSARGKIGVYRILNKENNKGYVGSSFDIGRRWSRHVSSLNRSKHDNRHLQAAWIQYGGAAFEWQVLEECRPDQLIEKEQYYLDTLKAYKPAFGYNMVSEAGSNPQHEAAKKRREAYESYLVTRHSQSVQAYAEKHGGIEKLKGRMDAVQDLVDFAETLGGYENLQRVLKAMNQ